jgi:hypothetical protein
MIDCNNKFCENATISILVDVPEIFSLVLSSSLSAAAVVAVMSYT